MKKKKNSQVKYLFVKIAIQKMMKRMNIVRFVKRQIQGFC